jgi:hypothetical protein
MNTTDPTRATLALALQLPTGNPYTGPVTIAPRFSPMIVGPVLVSGQEITVATDANGFCSVPLAAGWYTLATPYDRPVEFTMPDDGAIHTLADLVNRGALITPRFPATTLPNFAFVHGGLALRNQTDGQLYRLSLGADLSVEVQAPVSGAVAAPATPTARIEQGVLQFPDPAGALHSVTFSGTASAPMLSLGDATVTEAQRLRFTTTQLQLPNLDAGGYHALLLIQTAGGRQLAFGPNQA